MNIVNSIFDGLLGYEKLMLICGFILFVFALLAITVMIVQRRDFKMAMVLIIFAVVLMGFPGIQAIKFSQDMVELDRIRAQPAGTTDPAQQQQSAKTLSSIEERAADNPQLQAQVADGYRAIGEVNKGYQLAQSVLQHQPSAQVQATLVPVLTAKLNEVQAGAPIAAPPPMPSPAPAASAATAGTATVGPPIATGAGTPASAGTAAESTASAPATVDSARQHEIAAIARQLQGTGAPLPAASHAALAEAYVVLGQPQKAQANVDAAYKLNPNIKINAAVLHAARVGSRPTEH